MESILPSTASSWVRNSTLFCCELIMMHFFTRNSVIVIGDFPAQLNEKSVYFYASGKIPYLAEADLLVVRQGLWNGSLPKMTNRGLIVSDSLEFAQKLVTRNRINPQVVVLQSPDKCDVLIWVPYNDRHCSDSPQLKWTSNCLHLKSHELEVNEAEWSDCPLTVSLAPCPVYVERDENKTLSGAEISILEDLAHYSGMEFVPYLAPQTDKLPRLWYYTKYDSSGALSGAWALADENIVDLVGACHSMGNDKLPLACLPSHIEDVTAWHLPTAHQHSHLSYGFITAMPMDIWTAEFVTLISATLFAYGISLGASFGSAVMWTFNRSLSMPGPPLRENNSFRFFSIVLELCYLVLTSSYRSFLLYNLFLKPVSQLETGEEGAAEGLYAYIRIREAELLNNYHHSHLRSELIENGKLIVAQTYEFEKLVIDKTAMIMARTILDQAQIRRSYPNITYSSAVYVDKHTFTTNRVVFLIQPYHPLISKLVSKMLEIIEAGLPEVYLERSLAELPGSGGSVKPPQDQRALGISELATVFYMWLIGLILCIAAIFMEIILQSYLGPDHRNLFKPVNSFRLRLTKILSKKPEQSHRLAR